ncbi:MAG: hypothetical protein ACLS3Y_13435, partial [Collinsella sp.]
MAAIFVTRMRASARPREDVPFVSYLLLCCGTYSSRDALFRTWSPDCYRFIYEQHNTEQAFLSKDIQ